MKVLVCGGRTFRDREWLYNGLELLHSSIGGITELIEGGASGADCLAANWAIWKGIKHTRVPADWELHGRKAGALRNVQMAELDPDLVLAAPGGAGTQHMIVTAQKRGIQVALLERMPLRKTAAPEGTAVS